MNNSYSFYYSTRTRCSSIHRTTAWTRTIACWEKYGDVWGKIIQKFILEANLKHFWTITYIHGSRGTEKSTEECEAIMVIPYKVKHTLLRIVVPYFWICEFFCGCRKIHLVIFRWFFAEEEWLVMFSSFLSLPWKREEIYRKFLLKRSYIQVPGKYSNIILYYWV